MAVWHHHHRIF